MAIVSAEAASVDGRLRRFSPNDLSERGRQAYEVLLRAEVVEDSFTSWTFERVEATYSVLDLWDEPAEIGTGALLSVCENGTPAGRFYALAGLSESDPWTYARAYPRYGHDDAEVEIQLGCFGWTGESDSRFRQLVIEDRLATGWRELWERTERQGRDFDRTLKAQYASN